MSSRTDPYDDVDDDVVDDVDADVVVVVVAAGRSWYEIKSFSPWWFSTIKKKTKIKIIKNKKQSSSSMSGRRLFPTATLKNEREGSANTVQYTRGHECHDLNDLFQLRLAPTTTTTTIFFYFNYV